MENSLRAAGALAGAVAGAVATGAAASAGSAALASSEPPPVTVLAKGALRRLVLAKLEPTPENYTRAYLEEAGQPATHTLPPAAMPLVERLVGEAFEGLEAGSQARLMQAMSRGRWDEAGPQLDEKLAGARVSRAAAMAELIRSIVSSMERGNKQWTTARKKESLQRVLGGSRSDAQRLQQRLRQLVASWDELPSERGVDTAFLDEIAEAALPAEAGIPVAALSASTLAALLPSAIVQGAGGTAVVRPADQAPLWSQMLLAMSATAQQGLPADEPRCAALASEMAVLTARITKEGPAPELVHELERLCERAQRLLLHRNHMLNQLGQLCHELTAGLAELSEDASWARGQCDAMRLKLEEGLTPRGVRAVSGLLKATRSKQLQLRQEREAARTALRGLVNRMLHELDDLGAQTGRFHESVGRYADVIEQADTLESLADVVRDMATESRTVQSLVTETQERLNSEHANAASLNARVQELETQLQRLSEEVSTDQLTQIANRRGLQQIFITERARAMRTGKCLTVGLIDVDDFKRLNDRLGHNAGDEALKALAARMRDGLRPADTVARYGGEEFVVLLPETEPEAAAIVLTRLQRSLTSGLFMHEQQQVFVTFSAGVSPYRQGEPLEDTLDRADEALYEAKRTGKNRTCLG